MNEERQVWARIDHEALATVRNFFSADLAQTIDELFQNARRAGASRIDVHATDDGLLIVTDDGEGIADPATVLAFGQSRWEETIRRREHPAGMGLYSLAGDTACIRSRRAGGPGFSLELTPEAFEGTAGATVRSDETAPAPAGTSVEFRPRGLNGREDQACRQNHPATAAQWAELYRGTIESAARHLPVKVTLQGTEVERTDWLEGAHHVSEAHGIRFGVFTRGDRYGLNFHGHLVPWAGLPKVKTLAGTVQVAAEVIDAPDLQLTLPARERVVANDYATRMYAAARLTLLEGLAKLGPRAPVPYAVWAEARAAGVAMPAAPPRLMPWTPGYSAGRIEHQWVDDPRQDQPVGDGCMIIGITEEPETEATLYRAFARAGLGDRVFRPDPRLEGYPWYDALDRVEAATVTALVDGERIEHAEPSPPGAGSRTDAKRIDVVLSVRNGSTQHPMRLRTDMMICRPGPDSHPLWDIGQARMITTVEAASKIGTADVIRLLAHAYLVINDEEDENREEEFENAATEYAAGLLRGADARLIEAVRNATSNLWRLVPADKVAVIEASGERVDVRIEPAKPTAAAAPGNGRPGGGR